VLNERFKRASGVDSLMTYEIAKINAAEVLKILQKEEGHFVDHKAIDISPASITKTVSAFANAAGGEIYIGVEEVVGENGTKETNWRGFNKPEDANGLIQAIESLAPLANHYELVFLRSEINVGFVVFVTVKKPPELFRRPTEKSIFDVVPKNCRLPAMQQSSDSNMTRG
jgi:ATP-dependent DNA helicase RecG